VPKTDYQIAALWMEGSLGFLEQLCLKSFIAAGQHVKLYHYGPLENVPEGVELADANEVLSRDNFLTHGRTGSPALHSDLFRYYLLKKNDRTIWADTDAYCVKKFETQNGHFHGWESEDGINGGVLGLPQDSETLRELLEFTSDEYAIPPWFSKAKQAELQALKEKDEAVHVSLLEWGIWGPRAITWFLKKTGEIKYSSPRHMLYPLPFHHAGWPLNPRHTNKVKAFIKEDTVSVHLWGRRIRNVAAKYNGRPEQGSYIHELLEKHDVDPIKTARFMPVPDGQDVVVNLPLNLDFSMFDTADVGNVILQRPETGSVTDEVNDWIAGDDTALLKYADEHRDKILRTAMLTACRECGYFLEASDKINPEKVADIGCGYAFADLILYRRYNCDVYLIDIETSDQRHFGYKATGAGYSNLATARAFLEKNGVPKEKIFTLNPDKQNIAEIGKVDMALSLASCGFHFPIKLYNTFFETQILPAGGIILDIRKGSGGIRTMKVFGDVSVLRKHPKYSTVIATTVSKNIAPSKKVIAKKKPTARKAKKNKTRA